jgi:iron-sulfur cluster assembly protein
MLSASKPDSPFIGLELARSNLSDYVSPNVREHPPESSRRSSRRFEIGQMGTVNSCARYWKVTTMLTLTPDAAHVIQDLVSDHPGAGLRISSKPVDTDRIELGLAVTASPEPTDQIVNEQGSQVFLDLEVAPLLEDRTLDVDVSDDREVAFKLLP